MKDLYQLFIDLKVDFQKIFSIEGIEKWGAFGYIASGEIVIWD